MYPAHPPGRAYYVSHKGFRGLLRESVNGHPLIAHSSSLGAFLAFLVWFWGKKFVPGCPGAVPGLSHARALVPGFRGCSRPGTNGGQLSVVT